MAGYPAVDLWHPNLNALCNSACTNPSPWREEPEHEASRFCSVLRGDELDGGKHLKATPCFTA